ncbi:hypothetical protein FA95DRAFT_1613003 [Auriscalpium vulgare]|uniref:Uncharacterized protein n=1 Tax=Auriscalpium vulgare TaxID=40419 RepID=A0ACB8R597_9AGAM|nr:hypothetical protein FA95DRAFT_1613003 [Auriscalpium vulgare]
MSYFMLSASDACAVSGFFNARVGARHKPEKRVNGHVTTWHASRYRTAGDAFAVSRSFTGHLVCVIGAAPFAPLWCPDGGQDAADATRLDTATVSFPVILSVIPNGAAPQQCHDDAQAPKSATRVAARTSSTLGPWPQELDLVFEDGHKFAAHSKQQPRVKKVLTQACTKCLLQEMFWRHLIPAGPYWYELARSALLRTLGTTSWAGGCPRTGHGPDFTGRISKSEPFCHPIIIKALTSIFFGPKALHTFPDDAFVIKDSDDSDDLDDLDSDVQQELPPPMIAYVAALVWSVLKQWQLGTFSKDSVSGDSIAAVYKDLIATFSQGLEKNPTGYHNTMAYIYLAVRGLLLPEGSEDPAVQVAGVASAAVDCNGDVHYPHECVQYSIP